MTGIDYANYYSRYNAEWRSICADDKAYRIDAFIRKNARSLKDPLKLILDVGAGDGSVSAALISRNPRWQLSAADISESARAILNNLNIFDGVYDISKMPSNLEFDLTIACHVLEHVLDIAGFLAFIKAKSEFHLIEVPLEDTLLLSRKLLLNGTGHINFFRPLSLKLLLESRGLNLIDTLIYLPSLRVHRFNRPIIGIVTWIIKKVSLSIFPAVACSIFSYHMIVLTRNHAT